MIQKGRKQGYSIGVIKKKNLLFTDLCSMYFKRCEANGISKYTIRGYKNVLKYFIQFNKNDEIYCSEISINTFEGFKLYFKKQRNVKDITVNSYIRKLTPMLSFGMQLGYIGRFPYSYVKCQEVYKDIYTEEELKLLLKRPKGKQTTNRFAEFRNWVICNFLLGTGIRALELRELKVKNLDLAEDLLNLSHTKNKKPRQVPIPKTLHNILVEYLEYRKGETEDYLFPNSFGNRMPRTTLQMGITKYAKKRGVYKYSLHLFRHTFATLYLRNGGSIYTLKKILGHSSFKMTEFYLHMAGQDLKQSIEYNPLDRIKLDNKQIKIKQI